MELEEAIRGRRTHKVYGSEPVDRETLTELLELARWAPNHHLTEPWRFRVLGPESLAALKEASGPESGAKLDRAPTLICASRKVSDDPVEAEEDLLSVGCAIYAVLLGAHARGLVAYWRTPETLRTAEGARAVGIEDDERFVGLIYLGPARQAQQPPDRHEPDQYVTFLP